MTMTVEQIRHPEVTVQLTGTDGNAFSILGRVRRALGDAGVPDEEIREFMDQATAGTYDELLAACMRWVEVT
jgi:hypothetical protein